MSKNLTAIQSKKESIKIMMNALKCNEKVLTSIGSRVVMNLDEEIKFQQNRQSVLEWAETKTYNEILTRILQTEAELPKEVLNLKYGFVRGVSLEIIEKISEIELLEIAIDEHGNHLGGWS